MTIRYTILTLRMLLRPNIALVGCPERLPGSSEVIAGGGGDDNPDTLDAACSQPLLSWSSRMGTRE